MNGLTKAEERSMREEYGYGDEEIRLVGEAYRYSKMADDLRAQAAQSAHKRKQAMGEESIYCSQCGGRVFLENGEFFPRSAAGEGCP